ncbi:MAG: ADP-ribosylglycohydrolase family protein [Kofleriaceae bacterium]
MARIERARVSLDGLSVGDAFGEQLLHAGLASRAIALEHHAAPIGRRWRWSDDTAMAISIVEVLDGHGGIDPEALANAFARRYAAEPDRGYAGGARRVLEMLSSGVPFDTAASSLFDGQGSCGNGGAMRAAPIGAYFADRLDDVAPHAALSAAPTHAHPDGIAGAIAIAVATAVVFAGERDPGAIIDGVIARTPDGATRAGLCASLRLVGAPPSAVAAVLGNGSRVLAADTVPFAIWCAASYLTDFAAACWACAEVGGDIDTTCAMVGGIIVGAVGLDGIPGEWFASREPLPR